MRGDVDATGVPLTIADPKGIPFRRLLATVAASERRRVLFVGVPWWALYLGLRGAESIGLRPGFRSDSVISFFRQDPTPDFSALERFQIHPRGFPSLA